jgi:hypothetical protein
MGGNYQPRSKLLWNLAGSGEGNTLTGPGDSTTGAGPNSFIDIGDVTDLALVVVVGAPSGTTPTLMVQVDMQDAYGNWIPGVVKLPANVTAAGTTVVYGGLHGGSATAYAVLTGKARVSWVVGGTAGPSFPAQISLYGR